MRFWIGTTALLAGSLTMSAAGGAPDPARDWPQFRGIDARGLSAARTAPVSWNAPEGRGVKWRTPVPGLGHSSPIVWGDLVCVTTAVSGKPDPELKVGLYGNIDPVIDDTVHEWKVLCLDRATGRIRWERTAARGVPKVKRHTKATHANSTPATDGRTLVAMFGSEGLYAYELATGTLLWKKDLGVLDSGFFMVPDAQWGFASSPVVHEGRVVLQADVQQGSFLAAFDLGDGREIWRVPRQDVPTWSTPAIHRTTSGTEIVVNGWKHIGGYDFANGRERWRMTGGGDIPVPTPVVDRGLVYITNAHGRQAPIYAIRAGARGDITPREDEPSPHFAWLQTREGAYMQTPVVHDGLLYNCRDNGVLSVYDAVSGERRYQQRLAEGAGFTASPVAADGKIYFTSEDGDIFVVRAGPSFELLARNTMGEVCMATPAVSEGTLIFRTRGHLIAIE